MPRFPMLVTTPILFADAASDSANGSREILVAGPLEAALAARAAGAEVQVLALAEPALAGAAKALLDARGIACEFIECTAATIVTDRAPGAAATIAARLPSVEDVDRLLDRTEHYLARGVSMVVAASDLLGAKKQDFMERVVGRAWGFGVKTCCAERGESLKQAFHTQPIAFIVERDRLQWVTPPPPGSEHTETFDGAVKRVFEDPIGVMLVLESDGSVTAFTRDAWSAPVSLGPLGETDPRGLIGALAAHLALAERDDTLNSARAAYATAHGRRDASAERARTAARG